LSSKAVIFGVSGTELTPREKSFFKESNPAGFILFKRNCADSEQIRKLNSSLRESVGWHCPILIDQEGGRVQRLGPPNWQQFPPAGKFAKIALEDLEKAKAEVYENAKQIAAELLDLGINVNCAPMADLLFGFSHEIIGDRAFGTDPEIVSILAGYMARGLLDGGVIPILKHIPGHGRAKLDSHEALPRVGASLEKLSRTDFIPFINLNDLPWGMTAHIKYTAIDADNCATESKTIIDIIRNGIGFDGLLLTDDISMKALTGTFTERTEKSLVAGCDIILHCNGDMKEMQEIAAACPSLAGKAKQRFDKSLKI
jgi:beta-N-acetylhexosaminidase